MKLVERENGLPELFPPENQKYINLIKTLIYCQQNMIDRLSRIIRKKVGSQLIWVQVQSLGETKAIIVSNYKMRILATY